MSSKSLFHTDEIKYETFIDTKDNGLTSLNVGLFIGKKLWENYTIHPGVEDKSLLLKWINGEVLYKHLRDAEHSISKEDIAYWNGLLKPDLKEKVLERLKKRMDRSHNTGKEIISDCQINYSTFIKNDKDISIYFSVNVGHHHWNEYLICDGLPDQDSLEKWLNGKISKKNLDTMKDERVKKSLAHLNGFERGRASKPNHVK